MVDQVNQEENPIKEADKESIDRLFNLDPQFMTRENVRSIVEVLRRNRAKWALEKPKASKAKPALGAEAAKNLLSNFEFKL